MTATLHNSFDVRIDTNHTWDTTRTVQIEVYPLSFNADNMVSTDTHTALATVEIPNTEDICEDNWISSENVEEIDKLPKAWQDAVRQALETAAKAQPLLSSMNLRYSCGQTVFLTEYRFPADVEYVTTDGRYVVNMANTGELDVFSEDEIEPYDADRWNRD